jgi:hypothetical protein
VQKLISALLLSFLLIQMFLSPVVIAQQEAAKSIQPSRAAITTTTLVNQDIIRMVEADFTAETIIAQIRSAPCDFVTTPAALRQLKDEGVPDAVILAMIMATKSAPVTGQEAETPEAKEAVTVKIPNGVTVEVEAPFDINSQYVRKGDKISFRVVNPVKVDGVVVIAPGSTATAVLTLAERGGHFGRAGRMAWTMQNVAAVDGTLIPLRAGGRIVGDSHAARVATQMILTGAILWVVAPAALLHGFKRGENAILPAGKRLEVLSQGETFVNAPATVK